MDQFKSTARGSRHITQSLGGSTYDVDHFATSYTSAHSIPNFKPVPPLLRDCTGFIHSLVPTAEYGIMAPQEVKDLTKTLCRSALPERHPPWVMHDGREPMPAVINDNEGSGYASNVAKPTHQLVKMPRYFKGDPGTPKCFLRDQRLAREHFVKNPPRKYISETQCIFKRKPFHTNLKGLRVPENPEIICDSGFSHERGSEGGPQARLFETPPTVYRGDYPPLHLGPPDRLPSNNNDTRDVGTGYPHCRAVLVGGQLRPPKTKYQFDFSIPGDKETRDHLKATQISSSGFHSNNPIKQLALDTRSFCTDYKDRFVDLTPKGATREGHTTGNIIAHTQTFYPMASFRNRYQEHNDKALPGQQAYVLRSWEARSAPTSINATMVDGPLREVAV